MSIQICIMLCLVTVAPMYCFSERQLKVLFQIIDENGKGIVPIDELKKLCMASKNVQETSINFDTFKELVGQQDSCIQKYLETVLSCGTTSNVLPPAQTTGNMNLSFTDLHGSHKYGDTASTSCSLLQQSDIETILNLSCSPPAKENVDTTSSSRRSPIAGENADTTLTACSLSPTEGNDDTTLNLLSSSPPKENVDLTLSLGLSSHSPSDPSVLTLRGDDLSLSMPHSGDEDSDVKILEKPQSVLARPSNSPYLPFTLMPSDLSLASQTPATSSSSPSSQSRSPEPKRFKQN